MPSRRTHKRSLLKDADVLQVMGVALLACVGTAGLLYAYYFLRVWRTAVTAPVVSNETHCLLVFGKHAPMGQTDADFERRLDRAAAVLNSGGGAEVLLLGGGPMGVPTEAEVARAGLLARGIADNGRFYLEDASRDTLQNLRNARDLMRSHGVRAPVTLLSSRYHLARCLQFARQLGLDADVCAAESRFTWSWRMAGKLGSEAVYVCLTDVGTRWARLIRSQKMLSRVT